MYPHHPTGLVLLAFANSWGSSDSFHNQAHVSQFGARGRLADRNFEIGVKLHFVGRDEDAVSKHEDKSFQWPNEVVVS